MTMRKRKSKRRKDTTQSCRLTSSCQFLMLNFFITIAQLSPYDMLPPVCPLALWMRSHPLLSPDRWFSLEEDREWRNANHRLQITVVSIPHRKRHTHTHNRKRTLSIRIGYNLLHHRAYSRQAQVQVSCFRFQARTLRSSIVSSSWEWRDLSSRAN